MNLGYVKLWRSLMDKFYYLDSEYVHLWLHCLFRANHKDMEIVFKDRPFKINRGQFISSRNKLSQETGIQESKVERILKCFEGEQQLEQLSFRTFRLFTITNYGKLQNSEQLNEQSVNNQRTTREQLVNTDNKEKNDKKKKRTTARTRSNSSKLQIDFDFTVGEWKNIVDKDVSRWAKAYPACDVGQQLLVMAEWLVSNPGKRKSNYRRFITNWLTKHQDKGGSLKSNKPGLTHEDILREERELFKKGR